jgi:hypothetical protein
MAAAGCDRFDLEREDNGIIVTDRPVAWKGIYTNSRGYLVYAQNSGRIFMLANSSYFKMSKGQKVKIRYYPSNYICRFAAPIEVRPHTLRLEY